MRPDVTFALIGLNVLLFVITTATGTGLAFGGHPSSIFQKLALVPTTEFAGGRVFPGDGVAQGAYYRLLTSTFLHYGIVHIALNMYCLFLLGPTLEQAFGRLRYIALYLVSGLSGSALSYALGPANEQAAGASGAVFGLFAGLFVLQRKRGGDISQIATIIAINLAFTFAGSGFIDWRGHIGGLIGGALAAAAIVYAPDSPRRWVYQAAGVLTVLAIVVVLVAWRTSQLTGASPPV